MVKTPCKGITCGLYRDLCSGPTRLSLGSFDHGLHSAALPSSKVVYAAPPKATPNTERDSEGDVAKQGSLGSYRTSEGSYRTSEGSCRTPNEGPAFEGVLTLAHKAQARGFEISAESLGRRSTGPIDAGRSLSRTTASNCLHKAVATNWGIR